MVLAWYVAMNIVYFSSIASCNAFPVKIIIDAYDRFSVGCFLTTSLGQSVSDENVSTGST